MEPFRAAFVRSLVKRVTERDPRNDDDEDGRQGRDTLAFDGWVTMKQSSVIFQLFSLRGGLERTYLNDDGNVLEEFKY